MAGQKKADIIVVDGEPLARAGVVHLVNAHPQLRVCAEAGSLIQALELCARHQPSVMVFDPGKGEICAYIKDLTQWSSGTRTVILTRWCDALTVQRAFQAGASGYISRTDPAASLVDAVLAALEGRKFAGPHVEQILLDQLAIGAIEMRSQEAAALSNRELQIFRLIGEGLPTGALAKFLGLSNKTIETHRQRIKIKLKIRDTSELNRRAILFSNNSGL